jgi:hypothetical protein
MSSGASASVLAGRPDPQAEALASQSIKSSKTGRKTRRLWPGLVCCALYIVLADLVYGFSSFGTSSVPGLKWDDSVEQIWWLAWAAHALPSLHNLFLAQGQNVPYGQNFGVNGSMLILGVLFAPVTRLFGPNISFEILLRLSLASSAACMCFVLRRWTTWWPAAFVGGLLYGFSAYMQVFGSDLFLIFAPLPPLILLVLYETFVRQRWRAGVTGVVLGLLCVVQFFIWVEVLAGTVVVGLLFVALLLVVTRRQVRERWRYALTALVWGGFVVCAMLAYPVVYTFTGPQSIKGSPQTTWFLGGYNTDLLSLVQGPAHQWIVPSLGSADNALYLGLPLLLALVFMGVFLRARREILFTGAMMLITLVLSLGSVLTVNGHKTVLRLPFSLFSHLPALNGYEARRFALFTDLFAAAMFAIGLDELWRRRLPLSSIISPVRRNRTLGLVVPSVLAVVVILSWAPRSTPQTNPTNVPDFFTTSAVDAIPPGGVVLAFPYPDAALDSEFGTGIQRSAVDSIMLDQAESDMRFDLIGGYGWFPSPSGEGGTSSPVQLEPRSIQALFDSGYLGVKPPQGNPTSALRTFLRRYDVQSVLMVPPGPANWHRDPGLVVTDITDAIGAPTRTQGVIAWFGVGRRLSHAHRK